MTHPMSPEERPRVLVVDDEKFIREILAEFLGMEGYLVRTAEELPPLTTTKKPTGRTDEDKQ